MRIAEETPATSFIRPFPFRAFRVFHGLSSPLFFVKTSFLLPFLLATSLLAQAQDSSIHATKTMRPDGTSSSMIVDNEKRSAEERVEDSRGRLLRKTTFLMDDSNRYFASITADPKGTVLFRTKYKYDAAGRVDEEEVSAPEGQLVRRRVYTYGAANRVTNMVEYDANGVAVSAGKRAGGGAPAQAQPGKKGKK